MLVEFESFVIREEKYRGEVELPITVTAEVVVEKDGYATGDSPTLYDVKLISAKVSDTESYSDGLEIVKYLGDDEYEDIVDAAIQEVQE